MAGCVCHHRVHEGKRVNKLIIPVRYLELPPATQSAGGETQMRDNSGMLILLLMVLPLLGPAPRYAVAGSAAAQTVDGDTLTVAGRVVDLFAITAPAPDQVCREWVRQRQRDCQCGAHARAFLASLIAWRQV